VLGVGGYVWRGGRVMFEEKENFEKKVMDFRVKVYLALIPYREIEILKLN